MTTVLAYADGGTVWMVADSRTNVANRTIDGGARKIMRLHAGGEELLVGTSGNAGMPPRIRAAWPEDVAAPPAGDDEAGQQAWAEDVAGVLTQAMVDAGMVDADGLMDGHFLLAAAGRIWTVYHHAAIPHADGRAAVGTGESSALAALGALLDFGAAADAAVTKAVEAAIALDMWSGLPLQVEVLQLGQQ